MTNSIKNIVSEAISQAGMEAGSYNRTMTLADVKAEISCIVEFIKFDTTTARNMFLGFVETELQKVAASLYPAKMQMDQNGNYTSNSKLWA
jgi:hypothetical protein